MDALCLLLCITQLVTLLITVSVKAAIYEDDDVLITEMNDNGVFYSIDQIFEVLNEDIYKNSPGIARIKSMYEESGQRWNRTFSTLIKSRARIKYKPFVVIEGPASHMRKKVARMVAQKMRAKFMTAPFRHGIDGILDDKDVRRAFYALSKYTMANFVKCTRVLQPIVAERYWMDHSVYTIAKMFEEELPSENAIIYKWPEDLLKPDYMFLLNDLNTTYGDALSNNQYKFVEREIKVYKMFKDLGIIEIPLDVFPEHVAQNIFHYIITV